ncbi:putative NUDIX hydrolase [compost metagenome]
MGLQQDLQGAILTKPARKLAESYTDYACVALIVVDEDPTQIGFIRRAITPTDRWSGQMAFPGGRGESYDEDDFATVIREAREEVGLTLSRTEFAGDLDDMQARKGGTLLPFFIRPFVFSLPTKPELRLDPREVDSFHWVPVKWLLDPSEHIDFPYNRDGVSVQLPGIRLPSQDILWGLTYMMVTNFFDKIKGTDAAVRLGLPTDLSFWRPYP